MNNLVGLGSQPVQELSHLSYRLDNSTCETLQRLNGLKVLAIASWYGNMFSKNQQRYKHYLKIVAEGMKQMRADRQTGNNDARKYHAQRV